MISRSSFQERTVKLITVEISTWSDCLSECDIYHWFSLNNLWIESNRILLTAVCVEWEKLGHAAVLTEAAAQHLARHHWFTVQLVSVDQSSYCYREVDGWIWHSEVSRGIALCLWLHAGWRARSDRLWVHWRALHSLICREGEAEVDSLIEEEKKMTDSIWFSHS